MRSQIALLLVAALISRPSWAAEADSNGPSVLVQTTQVRQGSLPRVVSAYGSVEADATARESIMAPLEAIIGEVYVRVGEEVAKGAPLIRLVPTPQTSASYAQAVSALRVTSDSARRTRQLLDERLATQQQLADAERARSDARAALDALKAQGAAGPATLRAPFHAVVTAVSTSTHAIAPEGTALLELVRPNRLVLRVGVVPGEVSEVVRGDTASVTPIGGTRVYAAKVVMRGSVVDSGSGLVRVQIALPAGAFFPGQAARATITVGTVHGYVIPHQAILVDDDGETYVVQANHGIAKIVHVRVLGAQGTRDTVEGPLDVKAPLVLAGNYQLRDGMRVRLADSTSSRNR